MLCLHNPTVALADPEHHHAFRTLAQLDLPALEAPSRNFDPFTANDPEVDRHEPGLTGIRSDEAHRVYTSSPPSIERKYLEQQGEVDARPSKHERCVLGSRNACTRSPAARVRSADVECLMNSVPRDPPDEVECFAVYHVVRRSQSCSIDIRRSEWRGD